MANNNRDISLQQLHLLCSTEQQSVAFARTRGLIVTTVNHQGLRARGVFRCLLGTLGCPGQPVDQVVRDRGRERFVIRCPTCTRKRVAANGFAGLRLAKRGDRVEEDSPVLLRFKGKIGHGIELIYLWSKKISSTQAFEILDQQVSEIAIKRMYFHLQAICHEVLRHAHPMGGPGCGVVQIDEALMRGKRKANRGRLLLGNRVPLARGRNFGRAIVGPWVFGLVCRNQENLLDLRMFTVESRDADTLRPIIQRHVQPGAEVHSDEWAAYRALSTWSVPPYQHRTVNHSVNFVDPVTGAHTQLIECMWGHVKTTILRQRRGVKGKLDYALAEEWWRRLHPNTPFSDILREVSLHGNTV